jgi:hypothetical protein
MTQAYEEGMEMNEAKDKIQASICYSNMSFNSIYGFN